MECESEKLGWVAFWPIQIKAIAIATAHVGLVGLKKAFIYIYIIYNIYIYIYILDD